ncbi:carboxypeptidase B [Plutella xylostella]|uniref:carboxypeptidase B n=1 Tax=Plutella xylostella TaxID=51655 RepID=UPI002032C72A|nr:carboxypeptidase B [Plutella xylostella]
MYFSRLFFVNYILLLVSLLLFTQLVQCTKKKQHKKYHLYFNHTLFRGVPVTMAHLKFFINLPEFYEVRFWRPPKSLFCPVEFQVSQNDKLMFLQDAAKEGVFVTTIIEDVQKAFDYQASYRKKYIRYRLATFTWDTYHDLEDIYHWLTDLAAAFPNILDLTSIGESTEGRHILALEYNKRKSGGVPTAIVEGGIHGHEWISVAFVTYLIFNLVYSDDLKAEGNERLFEIADNYRWYLIPVANPDGYHYSFTKDRLWKKNRRNYGRGQGINLNKNFDVSFGKYDASKEEMDDNYCGPEPFSEKESMALAKFINETRNLKFYFAFHSYGEKIIIPYDNNQEHVGNYDAMKKYALHAADDICSEHGCVFEVGTYADLHNGALASGTSTTWVKTKFNTEYVFTFELRDDGTYGFALPADQIESTCRETLKGLLTIMTFGPVPRTTVPQRDFRRITGPDLEPDQIPEVVETEYVQGPPRRTIVVRESDASNNCVSVYLGMSICLIKLFLV